jgi:thiol-disulfide isomerase/thioredoxin
VSPHLKASLIAAGLSLSVAVGFYLVWDKIDKNAAIPESHQIIKQLEQHGAMDFELPDLEGHQVRLSHFFDRVVILNFWASWCGPCVQEIPSLLELVKKVPGVQLVAVSEDHDRTELVAFLKAFAKEESAAVTVLIDSDHKISQLYKTEALPETFIFSRSGKFTRKVSGAENWTHPEAIAFFTELLRL